MQKATNYSFLKARNNHNYTYRRFTHFLVRLRNQSQGNNINQSNWRCQKLWTRKNSFWTYYSKRQAFTASVYSKRQANGKRLSIVGEKVPILSQPSTHIHAERSNDLPGQRLLPLPVRVVTRAPPRPTERLTGPVRRLSAKPPIPSGHWSLVWGC